MKKLLLFLLVSIMSLGINAQTLYGDVNGDVTVNITDVNAVISIILDGKTMTPAADVNGDGTVNVTDLNAIINVILGGGPHLSWYLVTEQGRNIAMNRVAALTAASQYNETFKVLDKDGNLLADQVKKVSFEFLDDAVVAHESNNAVTASRAPGQDGSPIPSYKFLLSYQQDNQMFHESPEIITFQTDGNGHFSWNSSTSTAYDSARDISELDYVTRSATSSVKLPDEAPLSPGDVYIVGNDGYVIDVQQDGTFTTVADYLLAMDENGNTLYLSYANSDVNDNMQVVTMDSRETALALVLPILPNIYETMPQEHLNKLKDIFWNVPEVKALARAIDESIVTKGYLDMDYVDNAYQTAYDRLVVLLHLDTTYLSGNSAQTRGNGVVTPLCANATTGELAPETSPQQAPQTPFVVYPYNRGIQLLLNDARYVIVEATPPVDDVMTASKYIWQCDFELRNSNSFAYTSIMQGRLGPGGDRFEYVYDEPYEIAIFLNILKAQKVSSFLDTFTSLDGVIEDLGNWIEDTWKLLSDSEYFFDEMTWDKEIKKVTFNMSTYDDIVAVVGPGDNNYVLGYNILKVAVEPILKMAAKKLLKGKGENYFEEKILIPFLTDFFFKGLTDAELKAKFDSIIYDQSLSNATKVKNLADLLAPKLFDFVLKEVFKIEDKVGKEAIQEMFTNMAKKYDKENYDSDSQGVFYDNVLLSEGELENISYEELWSEVKMVYKWLDIMEKVGDATTGFLGLFEHNRAYEINLDFGDQLVLSDSIVVMPPNEKFVHIEMGKRVYDLENDNPALVSVEKSPGIKGTYLKITRNDINLTGNATITVTDRLLNKQAHIHVSVGSAAPPDEHEWVDLGLPSGTLWATCNVGASSPEEYGDYFAWGETEPKEVYDWSTYKWCNGSENTLTKYCTHSSLGIVDNKTELELEDDAAYVNWGPSWRIPTMEQQDELVEYCTWTWTQQNGINGQLVTGPNGNTIFLPANGHCGESLNFAGSYGYYWSRTLELEYDCQACYLSLWPDHANWSSGVYRRYGFSVRAVCVAPDEGRSLYIKQQNLDLGEVPIGQTRTGVLTIFNNTMEAKTLTATADAPFSLKDGESCVSSITVAVPANSSNSVTVMFTATTPGGYNGNVTFQNSDLDGGQCVVPVQAHAVDDVGPQTETFTVNGVSFKMVRVEGGTFTMGDTDGDGNDDEKPAHEVTLSSYNIGQTEVTQELWQAVMGSNPSYFKSDLNRPVEYVSWNDCQEFIAKLNQMTGKTFRLPTEAEWEFAARGGNHGHGYKYAGSDNIDEVAWYWNNIPSHSWGTSDFGTQKVATKAPNELGLYDMSGNVWEWCQDWYASDYYSFSPTEHPTGPSFIYGNRVFRGGDWDSQSDWTCRVSTRDRAKPNILSDEVGLRLAIDVDAYDNEGEWVDLGLPSGTLWATRNVGASRPEDYGDYFAWGETETKDDYDFDNYKWRDGNKRLTKYCTSTSSSGTVDGKTELDPEDDAANVNWGTSWRMPTKLQQEELREECTWQWIQRNGVNGYQATGPNGNTLFLPAAGYISPYGFLDDAGSRGYYWSCTLYSELACLYAYILNFYLGEWDSKDEGRRDHGYTVRAVRVP